MAGNLLFLLIWDPSENISSAIAKDKDLITQYVNKLVNKGLDVEFVSVKSRDIASYNQILQYCDNKTRVIIYYTGHGENLNDEPETFKDNFPCFEGNDIYIEQHRILEKLQRNILNVVIFDCCNSIQAKSNSETETQVLKNFTTIFDFEGELLVNSSKRGQSSFCRSSEGSEFTQRFFTKFCKSFRKTLSIVAEHCTSTIITYGRLNYLKYDKDDELLVKEQVIGARLEQKMREENLFRLLKSGDVTEIHSGREVRNDRIRKDMAGTLKSEPEANVANQ